MATPSTEATVDPAIDPVVQEIRTRFEAMRRARTNSGLDNRLIECYYRRQGRYTPDMEAQLRENQQPLIYVQLTPVKCRTVAAFLREVYTAADRPWSLRPTPRPQLPEDLLDDIAATLAQEVFMLEQAGQQVTPDQMDRRMRELVRMAEEAALKDARDAALIVERHIEDLLQEGGFYTALTEVIEDLVTYPYAVLKGPVVRPRPRLRWHRKPDGSVEVRPGMANVMEWERVDPRRIWWTPGANRPQYADFAELLWYPAGRLQEFLGVEGFNRENVLEAIARYGETGYRWTSPTNPSYETEEERSGHDEPTGQPIIEVLEYTGRIFGATLTEHADAIPDFDPATSYFVRAWIVDDLILRLDIDANPVLRPPYYVAQYVTIPGSMVGLALPELLADMQDAINATMRALVRNMGLASGPQVEIDLSRVVNRDDLDIKPWKVWITDNDRSPTTANAPAVRFYDAALRAGELMPLLQLLSTMADDNSAIPRYMTGTGRLGGAGRTATGLGMLIQHATRIMQTVAQGIDLQIVQPAIELLYAVLALQEGSLFRGDLQVVVKGAVHAKQRDVDRMRLLEFLNLTSNPVDLQLIGIDGRAAILQRLMKDLGLEGEPVDPQRKAAALAAAAALGPGPAPSSGENDGQEPAGGTAEAAPSPEK